MRSVQYVSLQILVIVSTIVINFNKLILFCFLYTASFSSQIFQVSHTVLSAPSCQAVYRDSLAHLYKWKLKREERKGGFILLFHTNCHLFWIRNFTIMPHCLRPNKAVLCNIFDLSMYLFLRYENVEIVFFGCRKKIP